MKVKIDRRWLLRLVNYINPLRDPSLTVAVVLTFIEEVGRPDAWYWYILIGLVNWLAVRGIVWLVVNFTFATTFLSRRVWWAMKHPRLAWRILDAVGHEEIVIGGLPATTGNLILQNGAAFFSPVLGMNGIQVLGELPAGTEIPMLELPGGQAAPDFAALASSGIFPGSSAHYLSNMATASTDQHNIGFSSASNQFVSQQSTDGLPQAFPQRPSENEERIQQQLAAYSRLLDDWIQFTEEKWRTVNDSQLGWKPLRGRWAGWDDIFQDVYAAKTSDPMAQAAQDAGEANSRRFDNSKEKGSAASAVACFLRDMMTLRKGLEILGQASGSAAAHESLTPHPFMQRSHMKVGHSSGGSRQSAGAGHAGQAKGRNTLIRRPSQVFVDADAEK